MSPPRSRPRLVTTGLLIYTPAAGGPRHTSTGGCHTRTVSFPRALPLRSLGDRGSGGRAASAALQLARASSLAREDEPRQFSLPIGGGGRSTRRRREREAPLEGRKAKGGGRAHVFKLGRDGGWAGRAGVNGGVNRQKSLVGRGKFAHLNISSDVPHSPPPRLPPLSPIRRARSTTRGRTPAGRASSSRRTSRPPPSPWS